TASMSYSQGQTDVGLRYTYDMRYYQDRADRDQPSADHSHEILAVLDHRFSERYSLAASDSFAIFQEPELGAEPGVTYFQRANGNNIRNYGTINFQGQLTSLVGFMAGYANTFYDYENSGGNANNPSLSGLLDRMEHLGTLDLRWQAMPQTIGI